MYKLTGIEIRFHCLNNQADAFSLGNKFHLVTCGPADINAAGLTNDFRHQYAQVFSDQQTAC